MNKRFYRDALGLAFIAVLGGCSGTASYQPDEQSGAHPPLPGARNFLVPPMQVPRFQGWADGQAPTVAPGLSVEKIASGLKHPRQLYTLPNGDVLVVESQSPGSEPAETPKAVIEGYVKGLSGKGAKGGNQITLLHRNEASGQWEPHVFLDHLHSPFGVQLIDDSLYVANTDAIVKFPYVAGETRITAPGVSFADLPDTIQHHWTKSLAANPSGTKLYVGVGSNSNITEHGTAVEYRRADILEVEVATGASRIYASGLRNPTGLQWDPQSNKLWAIVNERDEVGADLVPDYFTSVQEGGFYGWPYSYFGRHIDTRVMPQRPDLVEKAIEPDYAIGSHVAPLGLLMTSSNALPSMYQNGAFISEHGSWDRSPLSGYEVVFVAFKDGRPTGKPVTVVSGFYTKDESHLYGAPVGLALDKDGALLIADDVGNAVWRVSAN